MKNLIHPELSYKITGLCFKVHNDLGRFCREIQYADKLEELLQKESIQYKREFPLCKHNSTSPKGNIVDFLIENKIIIELNAKKFVTKDDYIQTQRYLKSANIELGLIVNFRYTYIKPKRILNNNYIHSNLYSDHSDKDSGH